MQAGTVVAIVAFIVVVLSLVASIVYVLWVRYRPAQYSKPVDEF